MLSPHDVTKILKGDAVLPFRVQKIKGLSDLCLTELESDALTNKTIIFVIEVTLIPAVIHSEQLLHLPLCFYSTRCLYHLKQVIKGNSYSLPIHSQLGSDVRKGLLVERHSCLNEHLPKLFFRDSDIDLWFCLHDLAHPIRVQL